MLKALVLGVVQGLTEFLPISSTAHLIIFPWLFGWDEPLLNSLTFDVALHLGTLVSVLVYFRRDWARLISAFVRSVKTRSLSGTDERLAWLIVAATVPAAVLGVAFEDYVETVLRSPLVIVFTLSFVAGLMVWAERAARGRAGEPMGSMRLGHAMLIGLAQACALIPGVSRSGATITAGLWTGYARADAARFSFLLSTPVIAGACALKLRYLLDGFPPGQAAPFVGGAIAAALSGYAAIAFLISYLKKHPLHVFAWYRLALAAVIAALWLVRQAPGFAY